MCNIWLFLEAPQDNYPGMLLSFGEQWPCDCELRGIMLESKSGTSTAVQTGI